MATLAPLQSTRAAFLDQLDAPPPSPEVMRMQGRVLEAVARGYPLDDVLTELCYLVEAIKKVGLCSVLLLDRDRQSLHPGVGPSFPPGALRDVDGLPAANNSASCGTAAFTGEMVLVEDTASDPRWAAAPLQQFAQHYGVKACWSSPFFGKDGEVLGTFAISSLQNAKPSPQDVELLATAANLASIAVDRAKMEEQLEAAHAKLRSLLGAGEGQADALGDAKASALDKLAQARAILDRLAG